MTLTLSQIIEDAPPPYTPTDPLTPASTIDGSSTQSAAGDIPIFSQVAEAPNFVSAAPFFSERGPPASDQSEARPLEHTLVFYNRSQARDYGRYPRCLRSRSEGITQHDWDTFLNYLLPSHLGLASNHPQLPQNLRADIERDRKDRPQETTEERRSRISAVIREWNVSFFRPRGVMIVYCFSGEDGTSVDSPLCPACYPNTTSTRQHNDASQPFATRQQERQMPNTTSPQAGNSDYQYQYQSSFAGGPGVWIFNPTAAVNNFKSMVTDQIQRYSQYISEQAAEHGKRVSEQAQAVGREVQNNAQAHAAYAQQQAEQARNTVYNNFTSYRNQAQSAWGGHCAPQPGPSRWAPHVPFGSRAGPAPHAPHAPFGSHAGPAPHAPHASYGGSPFQRGGWGQGQRGGWGQGAFGPRGRGNHWGGPGRNHTWGPNPGGCRPNVTPQGFSRDMPEAGQRDRDWGHINPTGQSTGRTRRSSVSSSSSSSSSSCSFDSVDSHSSGSDIKAEEIAALKKALKELEDQQTQRRISNKDYRARRRELRRDYRTLRSTRRRFHAANRRCRDARASCSANQAGGTRGELNADLEEIKRDIQEITKHYQTLLSGFREEKHELNKVRKSELQEEKRARKEAKRVRKHQMDEEKRARKEAKAARKEELKSAKDKGKGKARGGSAVPVENHQETAATPTSPPPPRYQDVPQPNIAIRGDIKQ